jgi:2-polyprenyl-6-methoxyphenol hydroxylase-like FAD-dependent oxidoreductase
MILSIVLLLLGFLGYYMYNRRPVKENTDKLNKNEMVDFDVVICGGGATGLLLGICLEKCGIKTVILEKRLTPTKHSKAIGIHPIAFEIFEEIDVEIVHEFEKHGLKVFDGICLGNGYDDILGRLKLDLIQNPYNYIMSCEQYKTEEILRNYYKKLSSRLVMGAEVIDISKDGCQLEYSLNDEIIKIKTHFVVGCDGNDSFVRKKAAIHQIGSKYLDTFMMGDFDDNTDYKKEAALFLTDLGLVESFPLPSGLRRWVCSTDTYVEKPTLDQISKIVKDRTKYDISEMKNYMLSSYQVSGMVCETYYKDRIILAGDAAHVCSPLGGQGMNVGWLDAHYLSKMLNNIFNKGSSITDALEMYNESQITKANAAIQRSEMYMLLGRKPKMLWLRNVIVWIMLIKPLQYYLSSFFTMRYLGLISCKRKSLF